MAQMAETDLSGIQSRVWCKIQLIEEVTTDSPTKKPTPKPVTNSPTKSPSGAPSVTVSSATDNSTTLPSDKDDDNEEPELITPPSADDGVDIIVVEDATTPGPSKPHSESPTSSSSLGTTTSPVQPIGTPVPTDTLEVETLPIVDIENDYSDILPLQDTDNENGGIAEGTNPSEDLIVISFQSPEPSASPVEATEPADSYIPQDDTASTASSWFSLPISPFKLKLVTGPQTSSVDTDELNAIMASHLQKEIQSSFSDSDVAGVDLDVSAVTRRLRRRQLLQDGLGFASDNGVREHDFEVYGTAHFGTSSIPTADDLSAATQRSFEGDGGNEFANLLQNAEDAGLKSTRSISAATSDVPDGDISENFLGVSTDDPVAGQPMYIFGIVFGVGLLLVALYVYTTRKARDRERASRDITVSSLDAKSFWIPCSAFFLTTSCTLTEYSTTSDHNTGIKL